MVHPKLHEWVAPIFWDSESKQMPAKHLNYVSQHALKDPVLLF